MATRNAPAADPGQPLAVTALFAALSPEFREAVVMRALNSRGQVSGDAGRSLSSAIRSSLRITGYRNSDDAPPHTLAEPVAKRMFQLERLAGAVLWVWAESHHPLQKIVADHLETEAIAAEYPDLPDNGFRGLWEEDAWERQLDWIADLSSDWDEDDLALMLCYVSGRTIIGPDGEEDSEGDEDTVAADFREDAGPQERAAASVEPPPAAIAETPPPAPAPEPPPPAAVPEPAPVVAPEPPPRPVVRRPVTTGTAPAPEGEALLFRCIAWLELLPAAAPEWESAVPSFVAAVNQIYEENQSHKERFAGLRQALSEIAAEFAPELDFLEQDTADWSADRLNDLASVNRMLERAAELKSLLVEYRQVHRPASSLSEELSRRERRNRLERQLLQNLAQMARPMAGDRGDSDNPAASSERETAAAEDDPAELPPRPAAVDDPDDPDFQGELIYEPVEEETTPEPPSPRSNPAPAARPRSRRTSSRGNRSA